MTEQLNDGTDYDHTPEETILPTDDMARSAAEVVSDQAPSGVLPEGDWPVLLTKREVAGLLNCSMNTIRLAINSGKLHAFRTPGGDRRFEADKIYEIRKNLGY